MQVHLMDGTYELFRAYYGAPAAKGPDGREVGATRGLLRSLWSFLKTGAVTHAAIAFDHVIESFRNDLFTGYKTGEGMDPELYAQFALAERTAYALGLVVWPMIEFEADDALATGAYLYRDAPGVEKVLICSPDKDMAQCVRGKKVVMYDRHKDLEIDENGVHEKFGVAPSSIVDWLALVGDTADGIPGVPKWGTKSASTLLAVYGSVDNIPDQPAQWSVKVRGADALAISLRHHRQDAKLYRKLATLREDVPLQERLDDLAWRGARRKELEALCQEVGETAWLQRVTIWAE
ncbi:MAG TPA: 5'-3' exonuclease H3TH domain-containing protein [Oligoflexus sp.]|uniref:5'-3' exonuclease n=1 Tax=Oligoflexus sp. TaxID=1971216 RepID=UPI002D747689|nr:5'-3' exonuclease H3TH domain-containing protein [Oligoflexus sp.]HYX36702.1 5'-3' exonuclease H3TH domain-containing protein [Oligoflexus sp.]